MLSGLTKLIENPVDASRHDTYAGILGANPSQGARSPHLWNRAFADSGLSSEMLPFDVAPRRLEALLGFLESDPRFVGGAIAVPHKGAVADWLRAAGDQRLSHEADAIGAVNCLYRDHEGRLCGTNTDGEGALMSVRDHRGDLRSSKVLLLGPGGAGKAVAAFFAQAIGDGGRMTIAARHPEEHGEFGDRVGAELVQWPPDLSFEQFDIVINCTIVGSHQKQNTDGEPLDMSKYTPLAKLGDDNVRRSGDRLSELQGRALVFDIIYDPSPTVLLKLAAERGLDTLDGTGMNLEQAVLAFDYATGGDITRDRIRDSMEAAKSAL